MDISRRKFLKGLFAAPIAVTAVGFFTEKSIASINRYFKKLEFNPYVMFRHAVAIHAYKVKKLEGKAIRGDSKLVGSEESLNFEMWTELQAFEQGRSILWDYINWKIPKRYHKFITFHSEWEGIHNQFCVSFTYHPVKCNCKGECPR